MSDGISALLERYAESKAKLVKLKQPVEPTEPYTLTAEEISQMGLTTAAGEPLTLDEGWQLKVTPSETGEMSFSLINPEGYEFTNETAISPTGETTSLADYEAQEQEVGDIQQTLLKLFPNVDLQEMLTRISRKTEEYISPVERAQNTQAIKDFYTTLKEADLTFETAEILSWLGFTEKEITEFYAPVSPVEAMPPFEKENWFKDNIIDPLWQGAVSFVHGIKLSVTVLLPAVFAKNAPFISSATEDAVLADAEKRFLKYEEEHAKWIAEHPKLTPKPEYDLNPFEHHELFLDAGYYAYMFSSSMAYSLSVMGTLVVVTAATGGNVVAGIGAGMVVAGAPEVPSMVEELLNQGVPFDEATQWGTLFGGISGTVETVTDLPFIGVIFKPVQKVTAAFWKTLLKGTASRIVRATLIGGIVPSVEGLEELVTQAAHNAILQHFDENQKMLEGLSESFIRGTLAALPFGVVGGAASFRTFRGALSEKVQTELDNLMDKFQAAGATEEQAQVMAVNEIAKIPEGAKAIEEAIEVAKKEFALVTPQVASFTSVIENYLTSQNYNAEQVTTRIAEIQVLLETKGKLAEGVGTKADLKLELARLEAQKNLASMKISGTLDNAIKSIQTEKGNRSRPYHGGAANLFPDLNVAQLEEQLKVYKGAQNSLRVGRATRIQSLRQQESQWRETANKIPEAQRDKAAYADAVKKADDFGRQAAELEAGIPEAELKAIKPPAQPPQTVGIPEVSPSFDARNKIIKQSQEVIKQSLPGAINRLFQQVPGIARIMKWERPALRAFAQNNPNLVVAQVAEIAARSDVAVRQVATRIPLFRQLHKAFGERALRGKKTNIRFIGTEEQRTHSLTGTLLDIAQNPELYQLTPTQRNALQAINNHNDASLNYVVAQYGVEIGRFAPKEGGAFLSNVDISANIIDWLGSEERVVASGRGKTRYWETARDRMNTDKTFQPELDIKKLIEGMDSFKSSQAAGVTFREVAGGLTRLEAIKETHPQLYERMMSLRRQLQRLKGYKRILTTQQLTAIDTFLGSSHEEADLIALDDAFFLQAGRYVAKALAGTQLAEIEAEIESIKTQIRELRPAWKIANLKPYVFVKAGLYRYFTPEQAKYIIESRRTTNNPALNFIERWRGQAFSGDFSPFAIQGIIGILADPIGSLKATWGGVRAALRNRDLLHSITIAGLIDDINSDVEGWAEFASLMERMLTGVPREFAAGFLSFIPGFDKFTEITYIIVTRGTKNLYDRIWQGMVKDGIPMVEAKVAAVEVAAKVYPLVSPAKLGQSQARAALIRAMPTSYSFIRQPATLIAQASMGYAKLITFQELTAQEKLAVRTMTTMAASVLATSALSAALSAKKQGKDDDEILQAILDAINPDPYNGKFASLIIGDFRIPLGGPYRAIFRAIYPQEVKGVPFPVPFAGMPNFIKNRITPSIKTQINLLLNKDYYKKQIITGQFPENILRGLLYELEGALPLSLGEFISGWRRGESFDSIVQQAAAQFVGVNLIQLDNTYFHKLVKNLGLPTQETPELYSLEIPVFTTKDLYGDVTRVLSDATLEEIQKRHGYPDLIAIIMAARDLARNVNLLPSHSPVSLNADPALDDGLTYEVLYQQWSDRQKLIAEGNDAEWTTQELVGGKYKTRTYHGADAVKAFDKEYPQAEQGNISQRVFVLLNEYWSLTDSGKQKDFLKAHPELSISPRTEWLKTHPEENAKLALWGQSKIYSLEAYNKMKELAVEYDIPDNALPAANLPPAGQVENYFKYLELAEEFGYNSAEVKLLLAQSDALREWLRREPIDTPIEALEISVKWRDLDNQYDGYSQMDSEFYLAGEDDRVKAREALLAENAEYADDRRRRDAYNIGLSDNVIEDYVEWFKTDKKLYREDFWLMSHMDFYNEMSALYMSSKGHQGMAPRDFTKVPDIKYAHLWLEWVALDDEYEGISDMFSEYYIADEEQQIARRAEILASNTQYRHDRRLREAWEIGLSDNLWDAFAGYYEITPKSEVEWYVEHPGESYYEDDWYLMEHREFYDAMVYLYRNTNGEHGWKERDFSKVPTREVWALYKEYLVKEKGQERLNFRAQHPDLDAWMLTAGKVSKLVGEKGSEEEEEQTPEEKQWEETEKSRESGWWHKYE